MNEGLWKVIQKLESIDNQMAKVLSKMDRVVKLKVFTSLTSDGYHQCPACEDTVSLLKEMAAAANGKIEWEEISIIDEKDRAESEYGVQRAPTILINDGTIRYTGAPIGLELAPFIQTVLMVSTGQSLLGDLVDDRVKQIRKKAKLTLVVTPNCPYCAQTALIENSLALISKNINVEIVESYENPDIARKYEVSAVPVTIINETKKITGVPNVAFLISQMLDDRAKLAELYG
jgi:glutaredoxin-like protein